MERQTHRAMRPVIVIERSRDMGLQRLLKASRCELTVFTALPQARLGFSQRLGLVAPTAILLPTTSTRDQARPARIFFLHCRVAVPPRTLHARSISERQRVGQTH